MKTFWRLLVGVAVGMVLCLTRDNCSAQSNDLFADRAPLVGTNLVVFGDNTGAGIESGEPPLNAWNGYLITNSIWYTWTAPTNGILHLAVTNLATNTAMFLDVYRGASFAELRAVPTMMTVGSRGFAVLPGDTLQIRGSASYGTPWGIGPFSISLWFTPAPPPPPNNFFTNRFPITLPFFQTTGTLFGATHDSGEPLPYDWSPQTLWWKFSPTVSGVLAITNDGSGSLAFYEGNQLTSLSRQGASSSSPSMFQVTAGHEYAVQLCGGFEQPVTFLLRIGFHPMLPNDAFADRIHLNGSDVSIAEFLSGGSIEPGEPLPNQFDNRSFWWSWVAPSKGRVTLSWQGPIRFVVAYTGAALNQLQVEPMEYDSFIASAGEVYQIQVTSITGQIGLFSVKLAFNDFTVPATDHFANARVIGGNTPSSVEHNFGATRELGEPTHRAGGPNKSIWWRFVAPTDATVQLDTSRSTLTNVTFAVYRGNSVSALQLVAKGSSWFPFTVLGGETYYVAAETPAEDNGEIRVGVGGIQSTASRSIPGNLVRNFSFEQFDAGAALPFSQWDPFGEVGASVGGPFGSAGADGVSCVLLQASGEISQTLNTVPARTYRLRLAVLGGSTGGLGGVKVSFGGQQLPDFGFVNSEPYWHWRDYWVTASNATTLLSIKGLGASVGLDAISVVWMNEPPQIVAHPPSLNELGGSPANFFVGATGTEPLAYQWLFNDSPLPGKTERTLVIDQVSGADAGKYSVSVTNAYGAVTSNPAMLVVEGPAHPTIILQPYGDAAAIGAYFAFSTLAAGPPPLAYQWYRDTAELVNATNRHLIFNPVQTTNGGTYQVKVWNGTETVWSLPATLTVTQPASSGGRVWFANAFPVGMFTNKYPVFDIDGATKLSGSDFVAQLYTGPSLESLRAVGNPAEFQSGGNAGLFQTTMITLPTVGQASNMFAQVRVWQRSQAASYEEARALGTKYGRSELLQLLSGTETQYPPFLFGLQSFSLQAGLPEFNVGRIQLAERRDDGTIIWELQGEAGFRYVIKKSTRDFVWQPLMVLTNQSGTVTFTDPVMTSTNATIYRSRILD